MQTKIFNKILYFSLPKYHPQNILKSHFFPSSSCIYIKTLGFYIKKMTMFAVMPLVTYDRLVKAFVVLHYERFFLT